MSSAGRTSSLRRGAPRRLRGERAGGGGAAAAWLVQLPLVERDRHVAARRGGFAAAGGEKREGGDLHNRARTRALRLFGRAQTAFTHKETKEPPMAESDSTRAQRRAETLANHFRLEMQQVRSRTHDIKRCLAWIDFMRSFLQNGQLSRMATGASARLKVAVIGKRPREPASRMRVQP